MRSTGTVSFRPGISLLACVGLAACLFHQQAPRPAAARTEFAIGEGGSVTIGRFIGGRTRTTVVGTEGSTIDVYADSSALANSAGWAESRGWGQIVEESSRGGTVLLTKEHFGTYVLKADQSGQSILIGFSPAESIALLAMMRGLPRAHRDLPPGLDRMATVLPDNPRAIYPKSLRKSRKEGVVILLCAIDTTGLADLSSIEIVQSNDSAFTTSVLDVMRRMRFSPAMGGGQKVRETVRLSFPFVFEH